MHPEQRDAAAASASHAYVRRKTRISGALAATMALVFLGGSIVVWDAAGLLLAGKRTVARVMSVAAGQCANERDEDCADSIATVRFSTEAGDVSTTVSVPAPGPGRAGRLEIIYRRDDPLDAHVPGGLERLLAQGGVIAALGALGIFGGILWMRGARRRAARLRALMLEGDGRPAEMTGFGIWTVQLHDHMTGQTQLVKTYVRVKRSPPVPVKLIGAMTEDAFFVIETQDRFLIPAGYPSED